MEPKSNIYIILLIEVASRSHVTFDQTDYTVKEGETVTLTGRLAGFTGNIETAVTVPFVIDHSVDDLTGKELCMVPIFYLHV